MNKYREIGSKRLALIKWYDEIPLNSYGPSRWGEVKMLNHKGCVTPRVVTHFRQSMMGGEVQSLIFSNVFKLWTPTPISTLQNVLLNFYNAPLLCQVSRGCTAPPYQSLCTGLHQTKPSCLPIILCDDERNKGLSIGEKTRVKIV